MGSETMNEQIEKLSEIAVFADPSDPESLNDLLTEFEEIRRWGEENACPEVAAAAEAAANLVNRVMLNETPDPLDSMEIINSTVSALQAIIRDGRSPDEVDFPPELGLEKTAPKIKVSDSKSEDKEEKPVSKDLKSKDGDKKAKAKGQKAADKNTKPKEKDKKAKTKSKKSKAEDQKTKGKTKKSKAKSENPKDKGQETKEEQKTQETAFDITTLPAHVDESIFCEFINQQGEVLEEMEELVLELEKGDNEEKFGCLKRLLHTLKGESALLGLNDIEHICHSTEDILTSKAPAEAVDILLNVKDWLGRAVEFYAGNGPAPGKPELVLAEAIDSGDPGKDEAGGVKEAEGAEAQVMETIEKLSEELVLIDTSDLQGLGSVHSKLEELCTWGEENAHPEAAAAATAAAKLLEKVMIEDVDDPTASMEVIGRAVASLQSIIRDGRSAEEAEFPEELGLTSPKSAEEDQERAADAGDEAPGPGTGFDINKLPPHVDRDIFIDFLSRQGNIAKEIEELVLRLEKVDDKDNFDYLKKIIHTLKAESALLSLTDIEQVCHSTEDILEQEPVDTIVDFLLRVKDWLGKSILYYSGKGPAPENPEQILARDSASQVSGNAEAEAEEPQEEAAFEGDLSLLGDFVSEANEHLDTVDVHLLTLESNSNDTEALNAVFRAFHTIKGVAGFMGLNQIRSLGHQAENLLEKARKGDLELSGEAIDITFDSVDTLKRLVGLVSSAMAAGTSPARDDAVPALVDRIKAVLSGHQQEADENEFTILGSSEPEDAASSQDSGEAAESTQKTADTPKPEQESKPPPPPPGNGQPKKPAVPQQAAVIVKEALKVDADRLDRLVDTIGELVIAESMVSGSLQHLEMETPLLAQQVSQLDKITRELQEMGTSLRMVPVRATFQKMARLVRDLSKKMSKPIEFSMSGEDTDLDKSVVDKIGDPLVHMVRNSLDHGIESSPEDRRKAGKSETGHVELRAFHKGGSIHIEIEDDGRGLDREAILKKAREKGLVGQENTLSDREVYNLIFEPGFSTAQAVTDVSGRGVGMDVVRRNIMNLRGQVDIRSEPGKGSIFSIRLPLTLAIIDGMIVRVGQERYIIPTLSIIMSMRPEEKDLNTVLNRGEMFSLHGKLIPLFRLQNLFHINNGVENDATRALVVVVEDEGRQAGLLTDELLGQQQIVIKTMGDTMRGLPGISGGSIMPDGSVGLILDISGLVKLAHSGNVGNSEKMVN